MQQGAERTVFQSALRFLSGSFLSRVSGLCRDITMAFFLGTSAEIAAFFVAFRLSNLLRRLFGEGALLNGFVPKFEALKGENPNQAHALYRDLTATCAVILIAIVCIGEGILYPFSHPENLIVRLTMLMLPGILFICLFALSSAILHSYGYFFWSGVSPVAFNCVWILSVILSRHATHEQAVTHLSMAIVLAACLQWFGVFLISKRVIKKVNHPLKLFSKKIAQLIAPMIYGVIGVGATQINSALDALFARAAGSEGPAFLTYAIRLQQLPLALFAISLATALLPSLSRAVHQKDWDHFTQLLSRCMTRSLLILIMGTGAIFCLGGPSVNLIFGHGDFTAHSAEQTTRALLAYGIGLVPTAWAILLAPSFYARHNFRTPTLISLGCIAANLIINTILIFGLGLGSECVALATSAASILNAVYLTRFHHKQVGAIFTDSQKRSLFKMGVAALLSCLSTSIFATHFFTNPFPRGFIVQLLQFGSLLAIYTTLLGALYVDFKAFRAVK